MELFLVRHAEDLAATQDRFADTGLSETGRAQAARLAERLRDQAFDVAFCSDLARARETAEAVLAGRKPSPRVERELAEGALGDLAGLERGEAEAKHPEVFRLGRSVIARLAATGWTAPGGETRDEFLARVRSMAQRLRREHPQDRVLLVSHGGFLNYFVQILLGMEPRNDVPFGFDHCGVLRVIDYDEAPGFGPFPMLRFG